MFLWIFTIIQNEAALVQELVDSEEERMLEMMRHATDKYAYENECQKRARVGLGAQSDYLGIHPLKHLFVHFWVLEIL